MPMPCTEYSAAQRHQLLAIARRSMAHGVRTGEPLPVQIEGLPYALLDVRCTFVTLHRQGELRGCTGSMEAHRPLAIDVAEVACRSALADPRFLPVQAVELDEIHIEISVLSPLEVLPVASESELLARLQPGIDGLVLEFGPHRATFLPKVWDVLPSPGKFLGELKRKGGLPLDFWSREIVVHRYHTESFADTAACGSAGPRDCPQRTEIGKLE